MTIPTLFQENAARARLSDATLADKYLSHTVIGDPEADALIEALNKEDRNRAHAWIEQGIEGGPNAIPDAPETIRDFFSRLEQVPPDCGESDLLLPGRRAFHRHSEMFFLAVAAAIMIEGFSISLSKSFSITGKVVDSGVRRLKQNNRHILEIMMPGGLQRQSDGWKLTVRARLVHARVRNLLAQSEEWDAEAWGTPLNAAHMAFVNCLFSARLLQHVEKLGVRLTEEERESFMQVWRYSGYVMGVVPDFCYASQTEALDLLNIAALCEPLPDMESIFLANATINSAPVVAGFTEPAKRRKIAQDVYQLSRELIGDTMAGQLNFPPPRTFRVLPKIRRHNKIDRFLQNRFPALTQFRRRRQFGKMIDISHYDDKGLRYKVPQHVHAEKDHTP